MPWVVQLVIRCGQMFAVRERTLGCSCCVACLLLCNNNEVGDTFGDLNQRTKKSKTKFVREKCHKKEGRGCCKFRRMRRIEKKKAQLRRCSRADSRENLMYNYCCCCGDGFPPGYKVRVYLTLLSNVYFTKKQQQQYTRVPGRYMFGLAVVLRPLHASTRGVAYEQRPRWPETKVYHIYIYLVNKTPRHDELNIGMWSHEYSRILHQSFCTTGV